MAQNQKQSNVRFSKRNTKHDYLLTGLVFCPTCGLRYSGTTTGRPGQKGGRFRYACGGRSAERDGSHAYNCPRSTINADDLDMAVWGTLKHVLLHPELIIEAMQDLNNVHADRIANLNMQRSIITTQLADVEKAEKKLVDLYLLEDLDKTILAGKAAEYKTRREKLNEALIESDELLQKNQKVVDVDSILFLCQSVSTNIETISDAKRKQVLRLLEVRVSVDRTISPSKVTVTGLLPTITFELQSLLR